MDQSQLAVNTYNKIADKYANQYFDDTVDHPYIDRFLALLAHGARILDIGSGPGQFSKYIIDKGFEVVGIDLSREMVSISKQRVPQGKFQFMDMRRLDFPADSFDGIFCAYALIHIPTEEIPSTLKGFSRILKKGGYLEIAVQQGDPDHIISEPFMPTEKMFFNFFSSERLSQFLTDAGFQIISQELMPIDDEGTMSDHVIYTIAQNS
jgi:ubiquinone/menaquinone biosynthesis C-methylase UbiE